MLSNNTYWTFTNVNIIYFGKHYIKWLKSSSTQKWLVYDKDIFTFNEEVGEQCQVMLTGLLKQKSYMVK